MSDKYIRTLRRLAKDRNLTSESAKNLLRLHAGDGEWNESAHPRGQPGNAGQFAPKGGGGSGGSGKSSSTGTSPARVAIKNFAAKNPGAKTWANKGGKLTQTGGPKAGTTEQLQSKENTVPLIQPAEKAKYPRKPEKGTGIVGQIRAARITKAGEASLENKVANEDSGGRFATKPGEMREGPKFAEGSAFNHPKIGRPSKELTKGTGATKLSVDDLYNDKKPDARHTVNQYLDDNGNLTPEREELHAQCVENLFAGKEPKKPGEKKTFTMFGGGSAAGKGGLSDPKRCGQFKSSFFKNGTPSKETVATIDSDELKKDIPEYRERQNTDPDNAAAIAHEESSAIAKRAMQAAFDNGYDCTLDGTGDGSVEGVKKKIQQARDRGYEVNACYVTCPTEQALKQAKERAARTGRNVKENTVKSIHREVSKIFPQVAKEFDHCALFDTSDHAGGPVLIAECERNGEIKVIDQKRYDAFLAKANET